jgi:hypothetical protein
MRVAKLISEDKDTKKIVEEHGLYAEVLGLSETPSGLHARLKFGDDHREVVRVQTIKILQESDWEKLIKDPYKRRMTQ